MDDSRTQAYLNLIKLLLAYRIQKDEVLNAHQELIDVGLVHTMRQVIDWLAAQGDEYAAEFLKEIANQLATQIGAVTFKWCGDFLLEIFDKIETSNSNQEELYSFLEGKEDKLNIDFLYTLKVYADKYLKNEDLENHQGLAGVIFHFSTLIQKFPFGDRSLNLEIAIAGYEIASEVYTYKDFPEHWAEILNNLAVAYVQRIEGSKAKNIEVAIQCLNDALIVHIREYFPERWAKIQINLGVAYTHRIKKSKAENFESAIKYHQAALEVYTREKNDYEWARIQNNLGIAYNRRLRGEKADNVEKAIKYYLAALKVRTREKYKRVWAMTQLNLGYAYDCRLCESKAENTEQAIQCYKAALEFYTHETQPEQWAKIKLNLGLAYSHRSREDQEENIEKAIKYYQAALTVYTPTAYREDWAKVYSNLAGTYLKRIRESKEENIELAIECCEVALQVYTYEDYPESWANTLNTLGLAYTDRSREDKSNNLKLAIANFELAAKVARENFPYTWALIQSNLIRVYYQLKRLDAMIECFNLASKIFTPTSFPIECFNLCEFFGELAFVNKWWTAAWQSYFYAIAAIEQSREWATNEAARQEIQLNAIDVYIKMVEACINDGQIEKALETVERSKSRNLVELLANSKLEPKNADDSLKQELRRLRNTIFSIRQLAQADNKSTFNRDSFQGFRSSETSSLTREYIAQQRELLQEYQRQLDEVFAQCQQLDPAFTLTQQVKPITVAEIRDLIDSHTAILEWYIGTDSFQIFIVTQSSLEVVQFDKAELDKLEAWNQQYLEALFNDTKTWQDNLSKWLSHLSLRLHLDEILNHPALDNCNSLILVPHRYLHLFPLHALSVSQQTWLRFNQKTPHLQPPANPCLVDCFKKGVRYAPSCQLLQRVQQRQRPPADTRTLFAIQNPTEDLAYTDIEVEVIKQAFKPADIILRKEQATKTALIDNLETLAQAHYVHFSCHGSFDFQTPLISSLILAGAIESTDSPTPTGTKSLRLRSGGQANPAKCLTLQDIFATLNLPKCRLVTLSACETGLTDTTKQSDDCIGLATGFLYAGSQGVLSSLWSVDDFATAYLMIRCYENLATADMAIALNTAQIWLRDATQSKLLEWIGELKLDSESTQHIKGFLESYDADETPFESPFYWAAFCAIGN